MTIKTDTKQKETILQAYKKGKYWDTDLYEIILDDDYPGSVELKKVKPKIHPEHQKGFANLICGHHAIQHCKKKWPGKYIYHGDAEHIMRNAREILGNTYMLRNLISDLGFTFDHKGKIWVPK